MCITTGTRRSAKGDVENQHSDINNGDYSGNKSDSKKKTKKQRQTEEDAIRRKTTRPTGAETTQEPSLCSMYRHRRWRMSCSDNEERDEGMCERERERERQLCRGRRYVGNNDKNSDIHGRRRGDEV